MKVVIVIMLVLLFIAHCLMARVMGSMVYNMFYVNSIQFEQELAEFGRQEEIKGLELWIAETEIPEYKIYLEEQLRALKKENRR